MPAADNAPNPVDIHVGARVRLRRKFQGLSQSDLAEAIGLTFQQVQKYERGSNRISASKLFEIAKFLKVPVVYFFQGYGQDDDGNVELEHADTVSAFLRTSEGIELAESFPRIAASKQRRKILDLVVSMAEGNG